MKVTDNGRKSLPELRELFDRVIIRYYPGKDVGKNGVERETMKTIVALLDGKNVHIGVSKWSNRGLLYSKTKGRAMAMGRAEIAFNSYKSIESPRDAHRCGNDLLAYTVPVEGEATVHNIIKSFKSVERELDKDLD